MVSGISQPPSKTPKIKLQLKMINSVIVFFIYLSFLIMFKHLKLVMHDKIQCSRRHNHVSNPDKDNLQTWYNKYPNRHHNLVLHLQKKHPVVSKSPSLIICPPLLLMHQAIPENLPLKILDFH